MLKPDPTSLFLREDVAAHWTPAEALQQAFALHGEVFRDVPGRRTLRVELGGRWYFVKPHYGIGWAEVLKNWIQFKRPVVGAENEFEACQGLAQVGLRAPVAAAYGASTGHQAQRQSFVLCDELAGFTSLEDVTEEWPERAPNPYQKRKMLYAVAQFARAFHGYGFIHRDFYICHLLADDGRLSEGHVSLAVLDLHRARRFSQVPRRWLKRDLAALLFSSLDLGYSRRDWLRFIRLYRNQPLREVWAEEGAFWRAVLTRAEKLYDQGRRKGLVKGVYRG